MKKMFAVAVLASIPALFACGGSKKSDTTPVHASPEAGGAAGGATYGGRKAAPTTPTTTPSASANPCAGK